MAPAPSSQVIAFLFRAGGVLDVAVEDSPAPHHFVLENSDEGAHALAEKLVPLRDMARPPFFCVGVAPGASLAGVIAEELMSAPVPRFLLAQPMYLAFASRMSLSPDKGQTLLLAYRDQFPKN